MRFRSDATGSLKWPTRGPFPAPDTTNPAMQRVRRTVSGGLVCLRPGGRDMIRQYKASRRRGGDNPLGVGVIAVGSIYYLQDRGYFHDRFGGRAVCRNPWIVEGFLNGICAAARRNRETGHWEDAVISGRSDMAM